MARTAKIEVREDDILASMQTFFQRILQEGKIESLRGRYRVGSR